MEILLLQNQPPACPCGLQVYWKPCRHSLWSYHTALSMVLYRVLRTGSAYQCQLHHAETNISSCRNIRPGYTASSPSTRAQLSSDEWKQALKKPDCKLKPVSTDFLPFLVLSAASVLPWSVCSSRRHSTGKAAKSIHKMNNRVRTIEYNTIQYNSSAGRDLRRSLSPTARPLQG